MKKIILAALFAMAVTAAALAQSYTVQEVKGKVEQKVGNEWKAILKDDVLKADTIVSTGIGASLTVKTGDQVLTVKAMVTEKKLSEAAGSGVVINIQNKISQTDTSAVSSNTERVSTASTRASDAAAETEFAE